MLCVPVDIDGNKRGQTSRAFADVKIQASRNFAKNIFNYHRCLGFLYRRNIELLFESSRGAFVYPHGYISVSSHLNFVLHENFLHITS